VQDVVTRAARQSIVADATEDRVPPRAALELIVCAAAVELIIAGAIQAGMSITATSDADARRARGR
jgi:hypothetical protein